MSYYALTDSDWSWDDEYEGRAVVVHADSPEDAVKIATEKHLKEFPGAGGVTWKVARLNLVGFQDGSWEDDNKPVYDEFTYYSEGINGLPDSPRNNSRGLQQQRIHDLAKRIYDDALAQSMDVESPPWDRVSPVTKHRFIGYAKSAIGHFEIARAAIAKAADYQQGAEEEFRSHVQELRRKRDWE